MIISRFTTCNRVILLLIRMAPLSFLSVFDLPRKAAKTRFAFWLIFLLFLLVPLNSINHIMAQESNLGIEVNHILTGNGSPGPYQLKDHFILQETERIERKGQILNRNEDYIIDYNLGRIVFVAPLQHVDTLDVTYKHLNLDLRGRYFHRELIFGESHNNESSMSVLTGQGTNRTKSERWSFLPKRGSSDLTVSGSKTFSFEVGSSRDVSMKQGLWLSARGEITEGLEISLQLSDQNMPASLEGTTKRVEELDKVQVLVKSKNFSGTLGDYYLQSSGSELSAYDKKLKGVTAQASTGATSFSFALASSKGEYFTNRFYGVEGKQGPYRLTGKNGEVNITILPGTERVWVDGEKMERGSGSDYTIDYNVGTIEFTPRRLITSNSRITVDLEYSVENYKRDLYGGDFTVSFLGERGTIKASGIMETDDQNHPTTFSFSSEEKQILSAAGNQRLAASKEGATFVGEGQGDYEAAYDSSGNLYYRHVGREQGSYNITFSWVGEEKGSYQYLGGGVYQYVYPGSGGYSPVILLPLPESHSLFDLNFSLLPFDHLKTSVEWAKSKKDRNTLSGLDDKHNWGDALSVKSAYQNGDFQFLKSGFHRLELQGEYRFVGGDFVPFGRISSTENERKWGLEGQSATGDEISCQLAGLIAPWKSFLWDFDYGSLNKGQEFKASRTSLGTQISPARWIFAKAATERIESRNSDSEGNKNKNLWTKNSISFTNRIKKLSTLLSWQKERRTSSLSGFDAERDNFDQLTAEASLGLGAAVKIGTKASYRQDITSDSKDSYSYILSNRFSVRDLRGMFSSDMEFTRRIKKYAQGGGPDSKKDLLLTRIDFYPPNQLINVNFYHSQNQIYSASRLDNYLEVGEGKGDYIYEEGRYVQHPEGNFILLSEWIGDSHPSLDLNKSFRFLFSPHKVSPTVWGGTFWPRLGKIFSLDSFVSLQGRLSDDKSTGFYMLYPLLPLSDERILYQNLTIRHDVYLMPAQRSFNLRLRWERDQNTDRLLSEMGRKEETLNRELIFKSRIREGHFLEVQIGYEKTEELQGGNLQSQIFGKSAMLGITRMQAQRLELKLSAEHKQRDEKIKLLGVRFYSLSPEFTWPLLSQGRLKAKLLWIYLKPTTDSRSLPFILSQGKMKGQNYDWRLFFDYKLSSHLMTTVAYSGESIPTKPTEHNGRVEVKALF